MKRVKSFLAMILCLTMLLSTLPMSVFAVSNESDFSYSVLSDGTIKITGYNGSDTEIVIPGTINGKQVSAIGDYMFYVSYGDSSNIVSVEVPEGVTSIGEGAFVRCASLKSIILPKTLTSIGRMCFYDLGSLKILYCGSQERWSTISFGSSWSKYSKLTFEYEYSRSSLELPENCAGATLNIGDTFEMGMFPQTEVTDVELINRLNKITVTPHSYEYHYVDADGNSIELDMNYADVIYGGEKYRRVTFKQYRPYWPDKEPVASYSSQDDNGYYIDNIYWFKWEPVVWKVLDIKSDGVYAISQYILDAMAYNTTDPDYSVTWSSSTLNKWLNSVFYKDAFSDKEKININSDISVLKQLISSSDRNNYTENYNNLGDRQAITTNYANSQGATCYWWLFDDGVMYNSFGSVAPNGQAGTSYCDRTDIGVRPVIIIDLLTEFTSSDLPSWDDDKVVKPSIKYGKNRLSFGENFAGYIGEQVNSLVVYTTETENITSLDITSSNTDIVEIGTIEIGVGDYITSENEHMATIPLRLKAEGTSTITITSPEGISESVKVTVSKAPEVEKSIAVFTTEKSLSVNTGDSMWLAFGLMNEDTGLVEEDWRKMAITVSDPTIISLSDYEETEYGYSLEIIGKKEGATNVTITDTETGINTIIVISVYDSFVQTFSYAIDDMKVFYPNNQWEDHIATNIYNLNGLYVNNYQCIKNGDTCIIDFDVYNSRYYAGAVDIYDESGMWLGYEEIVKYSDITSLWSTGEQAYYLISNTVAALIPGGNESNLLTYEQESFSKHTHISLQIPEGGYFTISNNVATSPGTFFINAFEMLFDGAYTALDLVTSDNVKTTALSGFKKSAAKSLADRLIEARNEGLKNELKKKAQKVMLGTMQSEITKITKKFTQAELKDQLVSTDETCSEMANLAENILSSYNISWKHLFQTATGVGESFFTSLSGPAGAALKGCFAITKSTNKLLMATQMATSTQKPYMTVYSTIAEGYINPYGVVVNTAGSMDAEAVLQVFRVSNNDAVDVIIDSDNPLEKHELYNICFVKDDQLVQPSGKVTVHIPIPEGMNSSTCKVYRQESDGAWTLLDAHIEGNYLVFETDHFSLYSVIGDMNNLTIHSLPSKVVYTDGDTLDTTGLVLDLNGELISEGFVCEPTVLSGIGTLKVTVRYGNTVTDFDVSVKALGGYMVSGNIESFGDQEKKCTLRLIDTSGAVEELSTSSVNYAFENIAAGTYTLEVSKADHVTRTYKITVTDKDVIQDVRIHLLGDATGDGIVDGMDVIRLKKYLAAYNYETDTSTVAISDGADATGDGVVDGLDVIRLKKYLAAFNYETGTSPIPLGPQ